MSQSLMATAIDSISAQSHGCLLVVSNSGETITSVEKNLSQQGFDVLIASKGESALLVSIEDSGNGFDHKEFMDELIDQSGSRDTRNNGISLVYDLTESLYYHGRGNRVEAIISERM